MSSALDHLKDELEACGLPWELKRGTRHLKLMVNGRMLASLPSDGKVNDANLRMLMTIRKRIRRAGEEATKSTSETLH